MSEVEERSSVIKAARKYIGTPYHSNAALKGIGVDCATMIMLAFTDAGVRPPIDVGHYSSQWHLHSDVPLYEQAIAEHGGKEVVEPQPGDIALYFQGRQFAHGAIITEVGPLKIIHAYAPARRVVEGAETEFGLIVSAKKKIFSAW
jgi:cell wall-associated NlpC family hydrolase